MFFVNPTLSPPPAPTPQTQQKHLINIQSILSVNPKDRDPNDSRLLYYHFHKHSFFQEMQRLKSLRATIMAISQIFIMSESEYIEMVSNSETKSQSSKKSKAKSKIYLDKLGQYSLNTHTEQRKYQILQKFHHNNTLALISLEVRRRIMEEDETELRQMALHLKKYSIFSQMQYYELIYIANYIQKDQGRFKEFLYKEGDPVEYLYLLQLGEFQVTKMTQMGEAYRISPEKSGKVEEYLHRDTSPFQIRHNKRMISKDVCVVQGGCGQSVGEVEMLLQKQIRQFSVRCHSNESQILKVKQKHFLEIFQGNNALFEKLKRQFQGKYDHDLERIKNKAQNLKAQSKRGSSPQKASLDNASPKYPYSKGLQVSPSVLEIMQEMNSPKSFKTLKTEGLDSKEYAVLNSSRKNISMTIDLSRKKEISPDLLHKNQRYGRKSTIIKSDESLEIRGGPKVNAESSKQQKISRKKVNVSKELAAIDQPLFPIIKQTKKSIGKSPVVKRKSQSKRLIDIEELVKQKEEVANRRNNFKDPQFSFYKKIDKRNMMLQKFENSQVENKKFRPYGLEEPSSPVHSPYYMRQLLRDSLKKAGYVGKRQIVPQDELQNYSEQQHNPEAESLANLSRVSRPGNKGHESDMSNASTIRYTKKQEKQYTSIDYGQRSEGGQKRQSDLRKSSKRVESTDHNGILNNSERRFLVRNQFDEFFRKI